MAPKVSWIAFGVFLVFSFSCQNVFSKKVHLFKKKGETVSPLKKSEIIGNIDLKKYSKSIKAGNCKNFKGRDQCFKMIRESPKACLVNYAYMSDNCRLACRFCSPVSEAKKQKMKGTCKDLHKKCGAWAKANENKENDCLHYVGFMMDVCRKSCEICGKDYPSVLDTDERCPEWGKAGFCTVDKVKMNKQCPYSCQKYASRHYIVKYAKPPKRRSPHPTHAPKLTKPTPRPTPPLTQDEQQDLKEAMDEFAEEEETRLMEKEEQRKEKDEASVTPLEAPPILGETRSDPSPVPAPALAPVSNDDIFIDVPSEYQGGTPPTKDKK